MKRFQAVSEKFLRVKNAIYIVLGFCPSGQGVREFDVFDEPQEGGSCSLFSGGQLKSKKQHLSVALRSFSASSTFSKGSTTSHFFDNNNCLIIFLAISLSINPSNFDINNLPIILKAPTYRLSIISFDNIQILQKKQHKIKLKRLKLHENC